MSNTSVIKHDKAREYKKIVDELTIMQVDMTTLTETIKLFSDRIFAEDYNHCYEDIEEASVTDVGIGDALETATSALSDTELARRILKLTITGTPTEAVQLAEQQVGVATSPRHKLVLRVYLRPRASEVFYIIDPGSSQAAGLLSS
ncbi:hypothetical protein B5X24_HaOG202687 [Helicoverpa armigera]|uniref:Uncharacterized protein n=1 Tax=Helicoverpa armigera TaxID=29058 RepID=A0A2W1BWJ0_HELAM|nr:hypothetical protein B5X24_HaOG202687 [Helicoverpa armigera]